MKLSQGIYFPDGEVHMIEWCKKNGEMIDGKTSYQIKKFRRAISYCAKFRTAVDVGGHIGMWSMQLAKYFANVHAFEPVQAHRECFLKNVYVSSWITIAMRESGQVETKSVYLHPCALGNAESFVRIETAPTSSGDSRVDAMAITDSNDIPQHTMDSFKLTDVDFIKLDCEGYELFSLEGGENTIKRDKPVIIVEQKPGRAQRFGLPETGAVDYLVGLGYRQAECLSGDYIMVPK